MVQFLSEGPNAINFPPEKDMKNSTLLSSDSIVVNLIHLRSQISDTHKFADDIDQCLFGSVVLKEPHRSFEFFIDGIMVRTGTEFIYFKYSSVYELILDIEAVNKEDACQEIIDIEVLKLNSLLPIDRKLTDVEIKYLICEMAPIIAKREFRL